MLHRQENNLAIKQYKEEILAILKKYVVDSLIAAYGTDWWLTGVVGIYNRKTDDETKAFLCSLETDEDRVGALDIDICCKCIQASSNEIAFTLSKRSNATSKQFISKADAHLIQSAFNDMEPLDQEGGHTSRFEILSKLAKGIKGLDSDYSKRLIEEIKQCEFEHTTANSSSADSELERNIHSLYEIHSCVLANEVQIPPHNNVVQYSIGSTKKTIALKPLYSILYYGYLFKDKEKEIQSLMHEGVKVFWFGDRIDNLEEYKVFVESWLLFYYHDDKETVGEPFIIVDGEYELNNIGKIALDQLSKRYDSFDLEQYLAEHSQSQCTVVKAGAGSGKTKVMVDHVLYLLQTHPDLDPSDISMITFTNAATSHMKSRFQDLLIKRFKATGNRKFLDALDRQSRMTISTIDSFLYGVLRLVGPDAGYSSSLRITRLKNEINQILRDTLVSLDYKEELPKQLFYEIRNNVYDYWTYLTSQGYSFEKIATIEFDNSDEIHSELITIFERTFKSFASKYTELKHKLDAMETSDVLQDSRNVLKDDSISLPHLPVKHIIIDEFQDTNDSQIDLMYYLIRKCNSNLFAVGDINQSIYRFRGASNNAFEVLYNLLKLNDFNMDKGICEITLLRNYRSSDHLIDKYNLCFDEFDRRGWLDYKEKVKGCGKKEGHSFFISMKRDYGQGISSRQKGASYANFIKEIQSKNKNSTFAILAYSNRELLNVGKNLRNYGIPHKIIRDGTFYKSDPVRDLYAFLSSFENKNDPSSLFNYFLTPYCDESVDLNVELLSQCEGSKEKVLEILGEQLKRTNWFRYYERFYTEPVLPVILDAITEINVAENYYVKSKERAKSSGLVKDIEGYARYSKAKYILNLDKLLIILQEKTSLDYITLHDIVDYLSFAIKTERSEDEIEPEPADIIKYAPDPDNSPVSEDSGFLNPVLCMTVHKAKGLEFDTVILPETSYDYLSRSRKIILTQDDSNGILKAAWKFEESNDEEYRSINYMSAVLEEKKYVLAEECHLLYVALTRAKNNLVFYRDEYKASSKEYESWSSMISVCDRSIWYPSVPIEREDWKKHLGEGN